MCTKQPPLLLQNPVCHHFPLPKILKQSVSHICFQSLCCWILYRSPLHRFLFPSFHNRTFPFENYVLVINFILWFLCTPIIPITPPTRNYFIFLSRLLYFNISISCYPHSVFHIALPLLPGQLLSIYWFPFSFPMIFKPSNISVSTATS